MTRRDYLEEIKNNILEWMDGEGYDGAQVWQNREEIEEEMRDKLWTVDSVTGNASGSYTMNTYKAEENIAHAWNLILEVAEEFGIEPTISTGYEHGPEWWDVLIRCYLLGEAITEALNECEKEFEKSRTIEAYQPEQMKEDKADTERKGA